MGESTAVLHLEAENALGRQRAQQFFALEDQEFITANDDYSKRPLPVRP